MGRSSHWQGHGIMDDKEEARDKEKDLRYPRISPDDFDAIIFDLDGVLTDTASLHFTAWKHLFDPYLERSQGPDENREFTEKDYRKYVDGKPRYQGVESFLDSRGISIPYGDPGDSPDRETICGLGNLKNEYYHRILKEEGPHLYDSTIPVLRRLEEVGIATAVVSSSRNCRKVLEAAGIQSRFDVMVDGNDLAKLDLPGKPDPALFLEAARRLDVSPDRAVVVEDATAGVRAGQAGGFALVVGVDRGGAAEGLRKSGAEVVVRDLGELQVGEPDPPVPIRSLPSALTRKDEIAERLALGTPVIFLDYDGTLTPIVDDPAEARLSEDMKTTLRRLSGACSVAIVSGRDRADVEELVGIEGLYYAGSHGFDVTGPGGVRRQLGDDFLPALDQAERMLGARLKRLEGVRLERKRYALAVHFRQAEPSAESVVEGAVGRVERSLSKLRMTGGKKIFELRPDMDWDKGKALFFLLELLGIDREEAVPLYMGDDLTDEDAFSAISRRGVGVIVRGEDDDRDTAAHYALEDTNQARQFLSILTDIMKRRPQ